MADIQAEIDRYLGELAQQRRLSAHTVANYRRDLASLKRLLSDLPGGGALETLQTAQVRRFLAQLHSSGLGGRSLGRLLSAWRGFFRSLAERGVVTLNPVDDVRPPKSPKALPKVLSPDEASRLLAAPASDDPLESRDQAMFELFYSSGLRLAELAALDLSCREDSANGELRVIGKRNKARIVPVGRLALAALAHWLTQRPRLAAIDEPALFVGRLGKRLGVRMIELRLQRRGLRQGLPAQIGRASCRERV